MPTQADLRRRREYHFSESVVQEGELKTHNDGDEIQRPVITDRTGSMFSVYVELVSCVHGQLEPVDATPATLIVLQYEIHCQQDNSVVRSVKTNVGFAQNQPQAPTVIAYAPYIQRRFNTSSGEITDTKGIEGTLGAEFTPAKADVKTSVQRETSHEQQYFEKLDAGRNFNDSERRHDNVWWRLSQNKSQKLGVTPAFRTAILLKRKDNSPFVAHFKITLDGGFKYSASQFFHRILGQAIVDDPINFDPDAEPWGRGNIDPTCLGKLSKEAKLDYSLIPIWGVDMS